MNDSSKSVKYYFLLSAAGHICEVFFHMYYFRCLLLSAAALKEGGGKVICQGQNILNCAFMK